MPYGDEWAAVFKGELAGSKVPIYFLEHEQLFGRDGVYGYTPDEGFSDNAHRYSFLCRAVFQICRMIKWIPNVIQCHDWASALVPYILRREEYLGEFSGTFSMLTIHNLGYQGIFPIGDVCLVRKDLSSWDISSLEFDNALNFLKTGIIFSDVITTVSPTYAKEIQTPEYGERLDYLLRLRKEDVYGILNGADYDHWNPETDNYISPNNFSVSKMANKRKVKKLLQEEFGLPPDDTIPVFGMITRLVSQKGLIELCYPGAGSLYHICQDLRLQFIILGSGNKWCEKELIKLTDRLENLKIWIGYNERIAHIIEAGSDFFLMPSKYEPCGLNQLYSMRYGTLPIVRNTGGLADSVENYNEETGKGTGFVLNDLTPSSVYNTVSWALSTWYNKKKDITNMKKQAMQKDFSWTKSAEEYIMLYNNLYNKRDYLKK
jgi:starch synthase